MSSADNLIKLFNKKLSNKVYIRIYVDRVSLFKCDDGSLMAILSSENSSIIIPYNELLQFKELQSRDSKVTKLGLTVSLITSEGPTLFELLDEAVKRYEQ